MKRAKQEFAENKLMEEAWLQKLKNKATGVGASVGVAMSSSVSLEVD